MTEGQHETVFPDRASEGLSWSWHLDLDTLLAALSEPAPWNSSRPSAVRPLRPIHSPGGGRPAKDQPSNTRPTEARTTDDARPGGPSEGSSVPGQPSCAESPCPAPAVDPVEAEFAEYLDAVDAGRSSVVPLSVAAGRVAEVLPASPDLAAWLACNPAGGLEDGALAGAAAGYRRLASWAQAGELAVVAQMASRSAAADKNTEVGEGGRPGKVPADAYGQVSLALTMSQAGAEWWTNLAVDLQWRLAATGLALREGTIDLARAKAIAEATGPLDDAKARAVEDRVLPRAGEQTTGQLRASLRRAVITADPDGAERRREQAERQAKVVLYPDAEGTASLSGQKLPGIRAAAAFARITALARALKAAGSDGGIDLLRSKVLLGLLLGTLPYIPPPPDGPADTDGPPDIGEPPDTNGPAGTDGPPATGSAGGRPVGSDEDSSPHLDDWPWNNDPAPGQSSSGDGSGAGSDSSGQESGDNAPGGRPAPEEDPAPGPDAPQDADSRPAGKWHGADGWKRVGEGADGWDRVGDGADGWDRAGDGAGDHDPVGESPELGPVPLAGRNYVPAASTGHAEEPAARRERIPGPAAPLAHPDPRRPRTRLPDPPRPHHPGPGQLPRGPGSRRPGRRMAGRHHQPRRPGDSRHPDQDPASTSRTSPGQSRQDQQPPAPGHRDHQHRRTHRRSPRQPEPRRTGRDRGRSDPHRR
ncbi:MAG TPA: DUF222 domain-containing protein, partial [Streptosporangiaceae bacterium]